MAEPKNESLHLSPSLSRLLHFPLLFPVRCWLLPSCSSFLSVSSPLTLAMLHVAGPRAPFLVSRSFTLVSHGAHACMHACISKRGWLNSRFRPGSRLSFSSRRREPQLVKKLPDRLGARRADSAVVYDPTPNTHSPPALALLYTPRTHTATSGDRVLQYAAG